MNTAVNTQRTPIRFGVLGAANINLNAIINPCFTSPEDAKITALAARDPARKRGMSTRTVITPHPASMCTGNPYG